MSDVIEAARAVVGLLLSLVGVERARELLDEEVVRRNEAIAEIAAKLKFKK